MRKQLKQTGQVGEYAVVSELCRFGFIATSFTRNMPGFDILALNPDNNKSIRIQVKTITKGDWSLDAKDHLIFNKIKFDQGVQEIEGMVTVFDADFTVFVEMADCRIKDTFFIVPNKDLVKIIYKNYVTFLEKHNGRRPRNPKTTHTAIYSKNIINYKDNWDLLR